MSGAPHPDLNVESLAFVEFSTADSDGLGAALTRTGFAHEAQHLTENLARYRQGAALFYVNAAETGQAAAFRAAHGAGVNGIGFRVADAARAHAAAVRLGAETARGALGAPALAGIDGGVIYLVDAAWEAALAREFAADAAPPMADAGVSGIDHVAFNLRRGGIAVWSDYFARVFGFREIRYFHVTGTQTGLITKALASPNGAVRLPLNESPDARSQIAEFLTEFRGEGVQHIALSVDDIHASVARLRALGVAFQGTPDSYYSKLAARGVAPAELSRLKGHGVLLDGDEHEGLLLQIFTKSAVGPLFFELIERRGNDGFGEGNVKALFESIEADQIARGVLEADA